MITTATLPRAAITRALIGLIMLEWRFDPQGVYPTSVIASLGLPDELSARLCRRFTSDQTLADGLLFSPTGDVLRSPVGISGIELLRALADVHGIERAAIVPPDADIEAEADALFDAIFHVVGSDLAPIAYIGKRRASHS